MVLKTKVLEVREKVEFGQKLAFVYKLFEGTNILVPAPFLLL